MEEGDPISASTKEQRMKKSDLILSEYSIRLAVIDVGEPNPVEHDFFNVHPNVMRLKGVVPGDWEWDKGKSAILTDSLLIEYDNGVRFFGLKDTLDISQAYEMTMGEGYEPPDLAVRYVSSLAPNTFGQVGMTWTILIPFDDPIEWAKNRFYRPEIFLEEWGQIEVVPLVRFVVDGEPNQFSFFSHTMTTEVEGEEDSQVFLGVICRLGFAQPDNDVELNSWVMEWRSHEERVISNLINLIGVENDTD